MRASAAADGNPFLRDIPLLRERIPEVRDIVRENLESENPQVNRLLARFRDRPGKMLRASLLLLSSAAGNPDDAKIGRLAAAVEILHLATLIHDDILDASALRRGVPTIHSTDGVKKAVLAGDYLFTRCFNLTAEYASPETARILSSGVGRICEAEIGQSGSGAGLRSYLRKTAGKTALLFMLSSWMGAKEAGCADAVAGSFRRYGYALGMAFQIRDDILDFIGSASRMGKPSDQDLGGNLMTIPVVLALREGHPRIRTLLEKRPSRLRGMRIRSAVASSDLIERSQEYVAFYTERALAALSGVPGGDARNGLESLSLAMSTRVV